MFSSILLAFVLLMICPMKFFANTVIKETSPDGTWLEAYINDDLCITKLSFSDASCVQYEYEDQKLSKIVRMDSLGRELYTHTYHWNESQPTHHIGWFSTQYIYDDHGRVTAKLNPWYQADVEYNSEGQAIRIGNKIYTYDTSGQITSEQGYFHAIYDESFNPIALNGQSVPAMEYDSEGNLIREGFIYDENNNLIEASGERYTYDALGRRIQKNNTCYLYLGFEEIGSFENGHCRTLKIPGIGGPIAIEIEGKAYAPIIDAQGIIRKLIDPITNSVYTEVDCDIFGGGLTDAIPYAYRGKRYDTLTNLIYFGKRYYDPSLHQWITPDPFGILRPHRRQFLGVRTGIR